MVDPVGVPARITDENRSFWDGTASGELLVEQCVSCDGYIFPPAGVCRMCGSRELTTTPIERRGEIYSYTINFQPWMPGSEVPYGLALVEFPNHPGVRLLCWVHPDDVSALQVGIEAEVGFRTGAGGRHIPVAQPGKANLRNG